MIKVEVFYNVVPDNPPEGVFISNTGWFYENKDAPERWGIINKDLFKEVPYIPIKDVNTSGYGHFYSKYPALTIN